MYPEVKRPTRFADLIPLASADEVWRRWQRGSVAAHKNRRTQKNYFLFWEN
jgi:hypothetical protein